MIIQQAVYTSAQTERLDGYQVVAASPGVSLQQRRELSRWCPAHDSLAGGAVDSLNFHPLPEDCFCISHTQIAGAEYSGRGGGRVLTHCLVVPNALMRKFANNPFRIVDAVSAAGAGPPEGEIPQQLDPIPLGGRASSVDDGLLDRLMRERGTMTICSMLEAAVDGQPVCVVDGSEPQRLLAGLFSLLPVDCRPQATFTTGLKLAARRPFRWIARCGESAADHKSLRRSGFRIVQADSAAAEKLDSAWSRLAREMLPSGRRSAWEKLLSCPMPGLRIEQLDRLALEMLDTPVAC